MSLVEFEVHGAVALMRLNRPEMRNAVDLALTAELSDALLRLEQDDSLHAGVLTGAGTFFCAGMDLGAFARGERLDITGGSRFAGFVGAERSKPIVAAVNGGAVAGGFEIALACDMIVAEETAFFALPEVKRGIIAAGGGAFRLPSRLPPAISSEILLTGDPLPAARAHALGLVNALVPPALLIEHALALAGRIAVNAPLAVRKTMEIIRHVSAGSDSENWAASDSAWRDVEESEDAREGALAFKEKRPAIWKGR